MTTVPATTSVADELETHRRGLTGYCYRMLGSGSEAEDAVQETFIRAWQAADRFEGRASIKNWLYRIAHNVCIDMHRSPQRRAMSVDLGPARTPDPANLADVLPEDRWVSPVADDRVLAPAADPAAVAEARESVRLAFVTSLQRLPARQRAALVLCDVLAWPAAETAELLDTTVASVNSALQRARATLAEAPSPAAGPRREPDPALLARYVDAFERYDMDALTAVLHDDVIQTMPPYAMWLSGVDDLRTFYLGPGAGCAGSRLVAGRANGCPAFAQYKPDPAGGFSPWALQVVEFRDDRVAALHFFLDTAECFPRFGFPLRLD
ncbi:sigma-70 family RNA polymerase sigma factor [Ilumatobacter sp.]|uniref:sigma-70 family RNA polymerase sigma factor n=1 Tax=Ilumatobacter sp. TaxID=1967498 RepID=UPI003B52067B